MHDEDIQIGEQDFGMASVEDKEFDKKEKEKREKIANDIINIGLIDDSDELFELSLIKSEFIAFEYRIPLTHEEYVNLMRTLKAMNRHIKDAFAVFDSYITFSNENPSSANILNLIYNFENFLSDETNTPFHQSVFEETNMHYFRTKWFVKYLNNLSKMLERVQGMLERAAKYIIDAENESRQGSAYDYNGGMGAMGGMGGFGGYSPLMSYNDYRYASKHPVNVANFNTPKKRDIGDETDTHEYEKIKKEKQGE